MKRIIMGIAACRNSVASIFFFFFSPTCYLSMKKTALFLFHVLLTGRPVLMGLSSKNRRKRKGKILDKKTTKRLRFEWKIDNFRR